MKTYAENTAKTLVTFHIGRGGSFNNAGFKSYCDQDMSIRRYTDHLFTNFENQNDFKNRFGFDSTGDPDQKCILDLMTDHDFDQLEEKFGITEAMLGDEIYTDGSGNGVGLTVEEASHDTGRIDEDGEYDTTYVCRLEDCSEEEWQLILDTNNYVSSDVQEYVKEALGVTEDEQE